MGDIATGYQSGESVLSDKHLNFLSTILEECTEDVLADSSESSTDRSNGLESSEVEHTDINVESDQPIRKQRKDGKRRKKVAFALPNQRHDDWISESYYDGNDGPGSQDLMESIRSLVSTEVVSSPKGPRVCDASQSTISRRLRTLKDVFDILDMPELSAIFKGFDSDCCHQERQQLDAQSSSQKPKKKKDRGKKEAAKTRGREKGEKKAEMPMEHKCDHRKIMRNDDGTRVEVDHHFKNSKNPTLLSWLEKKEKELRQKRKEERKAKKQERMEKKMKNLALSERKHLSDTLVKDWMAKKRKELKKKFSVKKVEPYSVLSSTAEVKEDQIPPGYMPVNTFSPEAISSDSPSQLCASDSGISSTSFNSPFTARGENASRKCYSEKSIQGNTSDMESSFSSVANLSGGKDHNYDSNAEKNKPGVHRYFRQAPKSVWADNLVDNLVETKMSHNEVPIKKVYKKKELKSKSDIVRVIPQEISSKHSKVEEKCTRKKRKHKTMQKSKDEGSHDKLRGTSTAKDWTCQSESAFDNDKALESKIILKEVKRRMEEKEIAKRRVYSIKTEKKRSAKKVRDEPKMYQWASQDSDSDKELSEVTTDVESKQRPEPQGSENACTKSTHFENYCDRDDNIVLNVVRDFQEKKGIKTKDSCSADEKIKKCNSHDVGSRHTSDADIESNEIDTDMGESDLTDTSADVKQSKSKGSHVQHNNSTLLELKDLKINSIAESKESKQQMKEVVIPDHPTNKEVKQTRSETDAGVQDTTIIKEVTRTQNKDFNDCLDFFLDDYQRPWKEL